MQLLRQPCGCHLAADSPSGSQVAATAASPAAGWLAVYPRLRRRRDGTQTLLLEHTDGCASISEAAEGADLVR